MRENLFLCGLKLEKGSGDEGAHGNAPGETHRAINYLACAVAEMKSKQTESKLPPSESSPDFFCPLF